MVLLIIFTLFILWATYWFLTSPYEYWKKKGVPTPKPKLIVGNFASTLNLKQNVGELYKEIYDDFKDCRYVGYYKCRRPGLLIRDAELLKEVLVKQFSSFHDNDLYVDEETDPLFGKNPFCLKGEKWKTIRSMITSAITHSKVRGMFLLINHVGENMMKYLSMQPKDKLVCLDVKDLAEKFTTDAVATCGFGLEGKSFEDPNAEFKKKGEFFSATSIWMKLKHFFTFIFPSLGNLFRMKFLPIELEDYFISILTETIKYRKENNIVRNDYLDLLLSLKEKPSKYGFKDLDVMAQAATLYIDGYETSSVATSYALYDLASNLDVQEKLRTEIKKTLAKHNGKVSYDIVKEMTFLDQVVSESLRLHPPIMYLVRVCTKSFELSAPRQEDTTSKVMIEVGTPIVIPVLAIHYDPEHYPNPQQFDPTRFSEKNMTKRSKYTFLSFGEGPRICLGFKFGLAQIKCSIVHILKDYKLSVNGKTQLPLKKEAAFFVNAPVGGLWLDFEKL